MFDELVKNIVEKEQPLTDIEFIDGGKRLGYPDRGVVHNKYIKISLGPIEIFLCNNGTWTWRKK